jgi:hypothetical protein
MKMQNMKIKVLLTSMLLLFFSCNRTMLDLYRDENLPREINGEVTEIVKYKGGGNLISVRKQKSIFSKKIALDNRITNFIRIGDYLEKIANSNMCIVQRSDSIIYLDCYDIPVRIRKELGPIKEWQREEVGNWKLKNER